MNKILLFVQLLVPLILATPRLRQMIEVCRHGARAPGSPGHPNLWTYEPNELTAQGARMHFLIGDELRKELIIQAGFLDKEYNPHQIYVRSTPYTRTSQSARSQLLGLYPQGTGPTLSRQQIDMALPPFNQDQAKQIAKELGSDALQEKLDVIPVHQIAGVQDYDLGRFKCPKYDLLWTLHSKTPKYQTGLLTYNISGLGLVVDKIYNTNQDFFATSSMKYTDDMISTDYEYPGTDIYNLTWSELETAKAYQNYVFYKGYFGGYEMTQLKTTKQVEDYLITFKECIANDKNIAKLEENCRKGGSASDCAKAKISDQNRLKFEFYSAHDFSIAALVAFLNITQFGESPPFASTFFLKLKSKTQTLTGNEADYFVQVLLNGVTVLSFDDFPAFEKLVKDSSIKGNIVDACKVTSGFSANFAAKPQSTPSRLSNKYFLIGIPIAIGIIVMAIITIAVCCRKKNKPLAHLEEEGGSNKDSAKISNNI